MKTKNLILGGGISGLICLHYIKHSELYEATKFLAKDFLNDTFPKYIHNNEITRELFKEIGVEPQLKKFKVGILFDGSIIDFFDLDIDVQMRKDIYESYCQKKYGEIVENKMNGFFSRKYSEEYISNKQQLIDKLFSFYKDRIHLERSAFIIDTSKREVQFEKFLCPELEIVEYENLISTIPTQVFLSKSGIEHKYKTKTLELFVTKCAGNTLKDYNFIYVADKNYCFHRVTMNDQMVIFENSEGASDHSSCLKFLKENKIQYEDYSYKKFSFPICKKLEVDNVTFIGRFSTGDYSQKIEEVVEDARQIAKNI